MTVKPTKYNIITKLDFTSLSAGPVDDSINEEGIYSKLKYNVGGSMNLVVVNASTRYIEFTGATDEKLYTTIPLVHTKKDNWQINIKVNITSFKTNNSLFSITDAYSNGISVTFKNTFSDAISIISQGYKISANYQLQTGIDYLISVLKDGDRYAIMVNGTTITSKVSKTFSNSLIEIDNLNINIGSGKAGETTDAYSLHADLYWANISHGQTLIQNGNFTKYGSNLISHLNFGNKVESTETSLYGDIECVHGSTLEWSNINTTNVLLDKAYTSGIGISTNYNISDLFSLTFYADCVQNTNDAVLISYYDTYTLTVSLSGIITEPSVTVSQYTTAALDFENGTLTDKVPTTTWTKTGSTSQITTNSIFGEYSFSTNTLGDSIYLPSNHINSNQPYMIEFYMLYSGNTRGSARSDNLVSIFSKNTTTDKYLFIQENREITWSVPHVKFGTKLNLNEINKIALSYDGVVSRIFVNDELESIGEGTLDFITGTYPIQFGYHYITDAPEWAIGTIGLWDNFNIIQGVVSKVRNDPDGDHLLLDMTMDGANDSVYILDNGSLATTWLTSGNAKLNTTQRLGGYSSLLLDTNTSRIQSANTTISLTDNFTISFRFMRTSISDSGTIIDFRSSSSAFDGFLISFPTSNPASINFYCNGDGVAWTVDMNTETFINANMEYDVQIVCDNNTVFLYVDGKPKKIKSFSTSISLSGTNNLNIGNNNDLSALSFAGYIRDVKLYDKAIHPSATNYRIRFDFDRSDFTEYYKNAGVTASNVTLYDDVAVKKASAYFTGTSHNFYTDPYYTVLQNCTLSADVLFESSSDYKVIFYVVDYVLFYYNTSSNVFLLETYNNSSYIGGVSSKFIKLEFNKFYNIKLTIKGSKAYIYVNDCLLEALSPVMPTNNVITVSHKFGRPTNNDAYFLNGRMDNIELKTVHDRYVGIWVQTISAINGSGLAYNPEDYNQVTFREYYYNTKSFGLHQFATAPSPNVSANLASPYTINKSVLNKSFYITAGNGTWEYTSITAELEFLNSTGSVIFALKWDRDGLYRHGMWYGPSLSNLTKTGQKGSYPQTRGNIYFFSNKVVWVHDDTAANANLSFSYNVDLSDVTSLRVNALSSFFDYTSSFCYFLMFELKDNNLIDAPRASIHLPLDTDSSNIGTSNVSFSDVGSPTFQTFEGKKCIRFESGKYINMASNNIYNFGLNNDFYMLFDFYYIPNGSNVVPLIASSSGQPFMDICISSTYYPYIYRETSEGAGVTTFESSTPCVPNAWNTIILKRERDILSFIVNGVENKSSISMDLNFSLGSTYIGKTRSVDGIGYLAEYKLYLGASYEPSSNEKKVLSLDFKPTRKSYLFKDDTNNVIINPVNITTRAYMDAQYCCSFNGTNQYLSTGKNASLNFLNDDFVIRIKFSLTDFANTYQSLIACGGTTGSRPYITIIGDSDPEPSIRRKIRVGITGDIFLCTTSNDASIGYNEVTIIRSNGIIQITLNGVLTVGSYSAEKFNLNFNDDTNIGRNGWDGANGYFKGSIYEVKIIRGSSSENELHVLLDDIKEITYTLSNGVTSSTSTIIDDTYNKITFVNANSTIEARAAYGNNNYYTLSVPKVSTGVNANELILAGEGYNGYIKDVKLYNTSALSTGESVDEDEYIEYDPYDAILPELESIVDEDDEFNSLNVGNDTIYGYIEGVENDRPWSIYHRYEKSLLASGTGDYSVTGIDSRYINEYILIDEVTKKEAPLFIDQGPKGTLTYTLNASDCVGDFRLRLFNRHTSQFIGEYSFNLGVCTISNLDKLKKYDAILVDINNVLESKTLSDRSPI